MRTRALLAAILLAALHAGVARGAYTTSYYMDSTDPHYLYTLGKATGADVAAGRLPEQVIVVLDYGGQFQDTRGVWHTRTVDVGATPTRAAIRVGAQSYAKGFWYATRHDAAALLYLGLGTNNSITVSGAAGRAWAAMVTAGNNWLGTHGPASFRYSEQVMIVGANDIEGGFCTRSVCPGLARDWADGYGAVTSYPYYNYGDCSGCPDTSTGTGSTITCCAHAPYWTLYDEYYVSYGAVAAFPLPEIYRTDGEMAASWERLAEYAHNDRGVKVFFSGAMGQHGSCLNGNCKVGGPMDNDGAAALQQLTDALNTRSKFGSHVPPPYLAQHPRFATDIAHR